MWQLLFFIIFILLIQAFSKVLEREEKKKRAEEKPLIEEKLKEYFETLGFPTIKIPPKKEEPLKKREEKKEEIPLIKEEKPVLKPVIPKVEGEVLPKFSLEKLEEGVILSEILGLPKALRIRRGGEIGRHARLKIS